MSQKGSATVLQPSGGESIKTGSLESEPVVEMSVAADVVTTQPMVGSDAFANALYEELISGPKAWRSSRSLATKLKVDVLELERWLDARCRNLGKNAEVADIEKCFNKLGVFLVRGSSKEDGVFFYALFTRVKDEEAKLKAQQEKEQEKEQAKDSKPAQATVSTKTRGREATVTQEERYALANLAMIHNLLYNVLDQYNMAIAMRSEDASNNLLKGLKAIRAGISVFASETKADLRKLPKVE